MPIAGVIMTGYCFLSIIKIGIELFTSVKAGNKPLTDMMNKHDANLRVYFEFIG